MSDVEFAAQNQNKGKATLKKALRVSALNQKEISIIAMLFSFIALIMTISVCFGSYVSSKREAFRVVDMAKLLNGQAISLAKDHPHGNVPPLVMQNSVDQIKEQIAAFGREHKVTLLAKGAVFSGDLEDVTQDIEAYLQASQAASDY